MSGMQHAIDLPIREGVTPRLHEEAEQVAFEWPPFRYWIKVGMGLTFGVWLAGLILLIPSVAFYLMFLLAWFRAIAH